MKPKVLIVEDELVIAFDIQEQLQAEGYEAIMNITSVPEAIAYLNEHPVDLVLLDINLKKDQDGVALGKYLLQKDTIPFIYLTSYSDKTTLERVNETRPYGYIVKPFKPEDLTTMVSVVLNNYKHRHIDVVRQSEAPLEREIPFILKKCVQYIHDNVDERITLDELVAMTRWGKQYFIKVFKEHLGETPTQYIIQRKIDKAMVLLDETSIPITQISYELGFKSHSNFCALFKKQVGESPERYRTRKYIQEKYL